MISEYLPSPAILVFSATAQWRHDSGIAGADHFFAELAQERQWGIFTTAHPGVFNADDLSRFQVIVFNNVTGNVLNRSQQRAFETWMREGGSWIGLHGSGDASVTNWAWYQDNLVGATFLGHTMEPQFQTADLVVLADQHPATGNVPARWAHRDEWYSFDRVPDPSRFTALIGIDESTYTPRNPVVDRWPEDLRMGTRPAEHPMVWARDADGYRAVYSAIGHDLASYKDPAYRQLLNSVFDWVRRAPGD
ncbi:MAG: ThuA domain-containing protein [Pseudomonadota bacterium]